MIFFLRSVSESPSCTGHFHLNVSPGFSFAAAENGNALAGIERSEHFVLALLAPQRKPIVTDIHRDAEWIAESLLSIRVDSDRRQRTRVRRALPSGFPLRFIPSLETGNASAGHPCCEMTFQCSGSAYRYGRRDVSNNEPLAYWQIEPERKIRFTRRLAVTVPSIAGHAFRFGYNSAYREVSLYCFFT